MSMGFRLEQRLAYKQICEVCEMDPGDLIHAGRGMSGKRTRPDFKKSFLGIDEDGRGILIKDPTPEQLAVLGWCPVCNYSIDNRDPDYVKDIVKRYRAWLREYQGKHVGGSRELQRDITKPGTALPFDLVENRGRKHDRR